MSNHRHGFLAAWLGSWALAAGGGLLYAHVENVSAGLGIYWAVTTVTTVGYGDITPHTAAGYWIASGTMILAIPVWSLAFSFFSSWLVSINLDSVEEAIKDHHEKRLIHHLGLSGGQAEKEGEDNAQRN